MAKTRILSFGYTHGDPPAADRVFDIRHTRYNRESWDREAEKIVGIVEPGETVAIGDLHGHTRSVEVATRVHGQIDDATVKHLDKGKQAMLKGSEKGVISENVRALKHQGKSEAEAVKIAAKTAEKPAPKSKE